jgi:hypothetical protein
MVRRLDIPFAFFFFALDDDLNYLLVYKFCSYFLLGFGGLGSERAKHYGVLAFSSSPTRGIALNPPVLCTY